MSSQPMQEYAFLNVEPNKEAKKYNNVNRIEASNVQGISLVADLPTKYKVPPAVWLGFSPPTTNPNSIPFDVLFHATCFKMDSLAEDKIELMFSSGGLLLSWKGPKQVQPAVQLHEEVYISFRSHGGRLAVSTPCFISSSHPEPEPSVCQPAPPHSKGEKAERRKQ